MRIGLISDTHGLIPDDVFPYLEECDEVWHAGDIGDPLMIDQLKKIKPSVLVWGNIDNHEVRLECPETITVERNGVKIAMIHIGGYPGRYTQKGRKLIRDFNPDLYISGHSHILKIMRDQKEDLIHMNPGSCGHKGFHRIRTLIRFSINNGKISDVQVIELGERGRSERSKAG